MRGEILLLLLPVDEITEFAALPAQGRAAIAPEPGRRTATQAAAPAGGGGVSGGVNTARSSSAMDRLTGDGMGAPAGPPSSTDLRQQGPRGGDTPAVRGASRGSSGASSAQSSSGFDRVQSSGTSVPRQSQGSSGAYSVQPSSTSVPRSGNTQRPASSSSGSSGEGAGETG